MFLRHSNPPLYSLFSHSFSYIPDSGRAGLSSSFSPSFIGLKRIHSLTTQANYELRIDLEDFDNGTAYAHYGSFSVGLFSVDPEEDGYPITISDYSGTAGTFSTCA